MREGLDAPTFELPTDNVEKIRTFLDGQSRFKLAMWVRHEQRGAAGPLYDHHLVLAVDDDDWATGDMRALEDGMRLPALDTAEKTWIDIYPVSEVAALRSFGTVVWEQTLPGDDPLDYRFTRHAVEVPAEALATFGDLVHGKAPEVTRVTATRSRLWKGESEIEESTSLSVFYDLDRLSPRGPLEVVLKAAHEAGIAHSGASLASPADPSSYATVLYDAGVSR